MSDFKKSKIQLFIMVKGLYNLKLSLSIFFEIHFIAIISKKNIISTEFKKLINIDLLDFNEVKLVIYFMFARQNFHGMHIPIFS